MKPSDSAERTRERKQRQRMSRPGLPVTPHVTPPNDNFYGTPLPTRTKGKTPEECGYPEGQVEVRIGEQGQKLWRLRGHYDMPNSILCFKA